MDPRIVECVPNISEGRRPDVIAAAADAVAATPGVFLLDRHSDPDHNRTVLTFAGAPDAVVDAAFAVVRTAAALIDLTRHEGVHPFIGAADVVPLVPLRGVTMAECAEGARRLGERIGRELGLPVYLYEEAALRSDRRRLESIRRGGYAALAAAIASDPDRKPDFGPSTLGPAGAVAVGARLPLIAFNINLDTNDVSLARRIAESVRQSAPGGLPGVKALGLPVAGYAQVSINLVDHQKTSLEALYREVERQAQDAGVGIRNAELVGLVPETALRESAAERLHLPGPIADKVLDLRIAQAFRSDNDLDLSSSFLERLASPVPPASGSSAAMSAAMAAALLEKVCALARRSARVADPAGWIARAAEAGTLRSVLAGLAEEDSREVARALAMRRANSAGAAASNRAAEIQVEIARGAVRLVELSAESALACPPRLIAEALAAGELAWSAFQVARINTAVGLGNRMEDPAGAAPLLTEFALLADRMADPRERLRARAAPLLGNLEP